MKPIGTMVARIHSIYLVAMLTLVELLPSEDVQWSDRFFVKLFLCGGLRIE